MTELAQFVLIANIRTYLRLLGKSTYSETPDKADFPRYYIFLHVNLAIGIHSSFPITTQAQGTPQRAQKYGDPHNRSTPRPPNNNIHRTTILQQHHRSLRRPLLLSLRLPPAFLLHRIKLFPIRLSPGKCSLHIHLHSLRPTRPTCLLIAWYLSQWMDREPCRHFWRRDNGLLLSTWLQCTDFACD